MPTALVKMMRVVLATVYRIYDTADNIDVNLMAFRLRRLMLHAAQPSTP